MFLPQMEAFLESFFWKASQLLHRIPHDVFAAVKTGTLGGLFNLGNNQKSQGAMSGE
jgi:hypothetical protein